MNLAAKMLLLTALLGAEILVARCGQAHTVIAGAQDMDGSMLFLTDTLEDAKGPCEGCPAAISLPPSHNAEQGVEGCWRTTDDNRVEVTYLLGDGATWTDTYPKDDFLLTNYGRKLRADFQKDI